MSASQRTSKGLPIYAGTDVTSWNTDFNLGMNRTNELFVENDNTFETIQTNVTNAVNTADEASETAISAETLAQTASDTVLSYGQWYTYTATNPNTSKFTQYSGVINYNPVMRLMNVSLNIVANANFVANEVLIVIPSSVPVTPTGNLTMYNSLLFFKSVAEGAENHNFILTPTDVRLGSNLYDITGTSQTVWSNFTTFMYWAPAPFQIEG